MRHQFALTLGVLGVFCAAGAAGAQEAVLCPAPPGSIQAILEPVAAGDPGPLFAAAEQEVVFFGRNLKADFGFEYLHPTFSSRAVTLAVPASAGGPLVADTGNFSHSFAFIPRFGLEYQFPDLGFGVGASGKWISISGHLQRAISSTDGSGILNVQSGVDIAAANFLEGTKLLALNGVKCLQGSFLEDTTLEVSLGARYSYVRQDYTATLANGPNVASLSATQSFTGFGVTSSVGMLQPLFGDFYLYSTARGSVLVGPNNRSTSISVVAPAVPGASSATAVTEDRTSLIGVGEFELGVAWGAPLRRDSAAAAGAPAPLLWFKAGWVGQIWGDLGLLSASERPLAFSNTSLFLQGFTLLVGIDY